MNNVDVLDNSQSESKKLRIKTSEEHKTSVNNKSEVNNNTLKITDIFVFLIVSACSYLMAILYEFTYAYAMGIPVQFIEPYNSRVLIIALTSVILILVSLHTLGMMAFVAAHFKNTDWYGKVFGTLFVVGLTYVNWQYFYLIDWPYWGYVLAAVFQLWLLFCCITLMFGFEPDEKNQSDYEKVWGMCLGWLDKMLDNKLATVAFWLIFFVIMSATAGRLEAKNGWFYSQLQYNTKTYLLLRSYGDKAVLGCYDTKHQYLTDEIILISHDKLEGIPLTPYCGTAPKHKPMTNTNQN